MPPYAVDVTRYLKKGKNSLEIKVTNLWPNRHIGDQHYPANNGGYKLVIYRPQVKMPQWYLNNNPWLKGRRSTFSTYSFYHKCHPACGVLCK